MVESHLGGGTPPRVAAARTSDLALALAALVVAGLLLAFGLLADEVVEGGTRAFDRAVLLALRNPSDPSDPLGPPWLEEMGRDVTALGSFAVLGLGLAAVLGYLALTGRRGAAWLVAAAVLGGVALSQGLKLGFDRPRPDLVPATARVFTASFPSGHATLSAVVFLTLGALLTRLEADRRLKAYVMAVAVLLTVLVGLSRLYLGVHYPSDVLAGWCIGTAWAVLCWFVALRLQQRGEVEPPEASVPVAEAPGAATPGKFRG